MINRLALLVYHTNLQEEHMQHGSPSFPRFSQLSDFAIILAQVVFPVPRGPVSNAVCGNRPSAIFLFICLTAIS